ncbi:MAG: succinate dehydrogenase [Polyangiaceae bacterium]|nr:succinate dehydrogenase [Polyangiaceae bacterium]
MPGTNDSGSATSRQAAFVAHSPPASRFVLRKLHSLSGVVPVGVFLVMHLWSTAVALQGQGAFERSMTEAREAPYRSVVEIVFVMIPLAFHALYGVKLGFEPRQNTGKYPYSRNWMYAAQRLTGILALGFIIWHVSEFWGPRMAGDMVEEAYYPTLCANLSMTAYGIPWMAFAYLFGIAATVFHFANGLWGFCVSWGITSSRRSQRISATVFGLAGLALFAVGANTAIYFATGARLAVLGVPAHTRTAQLTKTCADITVAPGVEAAPKIELTKPATPPSPPPPPPVTP